MDRFQISTTASPWFILLCLLAGGIYAYALYQPKPIWSRTVNWVLAGCRFLLVSLVCFLLLGPLVRQLMRTFEKPAVVLAIDNSQSMKQAGDTAVLQQNLQQLTQLANELRQKNIEVEVQSLDGKVLPQVPDVQSFSTATTNLSQLLGTVQSTYENRNLAGVVLFSDGIYNQGISPEYQPYNFPVFSVAAGDTVPRRDLNLKALYFNKITYLGNQFPVVAELHSHGYAGKVVSVLLKQGGKVLASQSVAVRKEEDIQEVTFYTTAQVKGIQHYVVEVSAQPDEFTLQNNARDAYVEVIDGKEKILILAAAPHPDIKAIRSALEKNDNYQVEVVVAGMGVPKEARYDLVVLHQIPDVQGTGLGLARRFLEQKTPVWFIAGSQSNLQQLNAVNEVVKIIPRGYQGDQVFPTYNTRFAFFTFAESNASLLQKMPPVTVPFADFRLTPGTEVILYQRVGTVQTDKPLLVFNPTKTPKAAVLLGEGIWEWRMEEYNLTENQVAIDELVSKLAQLLSSKDDKRKLRVYPVADEFLDTEPVVLEAEVYNDIYEKIYGQKIDLQIRTAENKVTTYSFTPTEGNSRFALSRLPKGVYSYKASTLIKGKTEQIVGEFVVKDQQLEALNTTADHELMRKLATQTNGAFYLPGQIAQLAQRLTQNPPPDRIQSREETLEMIHLKWIFFVLLLLVTIEWATRKFMGGY